MKFYLTYIDTDNCAQVTDRPFDEMAELLNWLRDFRTNTLTPCNAFSHLQIRVDHRQGESTIVRTSLDQYDTQELLQELLERSNTEDY